MQPMKIAQTLKTFAIEPGGRKYGLFLICMGALIIGLAICGFLPAAASQYAIYVGGVSALYGVYCGANVMGEKWSPTDQNADKPKEPDEHSDLPGPQN